MSRFVDAIIVYRILKKLSTPFNETEAYKLGIIDDKGNVLKKFSSLTSPEEMNAYTLLDRLIWRIKKIIERVPNEKSKILSMAAAFALVREHLENNREPMASDFELRFNRLDEQDLSWEITQVESYLSGRRTFSMHVEEMGSMGIIPNSVADGFSSQANANPNPHLAGKDQGLGRGKKILRRPRPKM